MRLKFNNYIQNLSISDNFKLVILDTNFLATNPEYYQKYPELFAKVFVIVLWFSLLWLYIVFFILCLNQKSRFNSIFPTKFLEFYQDSFKN